MKLYFVKNVEDNVVSEAASQDWDASDFANFVPRGGKSIKEGYPDSPLFGAYLFDLDPDTLEAHRGNTSVTALTAFVLDFDHGWTLDEAVPFMLDTNLTHFGYTSFNHQVDGQGDRFRVVFPFKDPCPPPEWKLRRDAAMSLFPEADDSSKAICRFFYTPACPPDKLRDAFAWSHDGVLLDWRDFQRKPEPPPYVPLDPASFSRDPRYKTCPVNWRTLDLVSFFKDRGAYLGPVDGVKHNVVCPNHQSHTGAAKSGTVVYQGGPTDAYFYCGHAHCAHLNNTRAFIGAYAPELVLYCAKDVPSQPNLSLLRRKKTT